MVVQSPLLTSTGVQTQIAGIFASAAAGVIVGHGLIVGQRSLTTSGNDHAIYLARTPMPDEPLEGLTPLQIQSKIGGPDIDIDWMSEHAKQVILWFHENLWYGKIQHSISPITLIKSCLC